MQCFQACLGESSTRMGDLLGSPRVAFLLFVSLSPLLTRAAASLVLCRPLGESWGESDFDSRRCVPRVVSPLGRELGRIGCNIFCRCPWIYHLPDSESV